MTAHSQEQLLTEIATSLQRTSAAIAALNSALARANQSTPPAGAAQTLVYTWDDPFSEQTVTGEPVAGSPIAVPTTSFVNPRMQIAIDGRSYPMGLHVPGSPAFRYWVAAEALARGVEFWSSVLPDGTTWSTSNPMPVVLDAGVDLNARYYRLGGLRFYRGKQGSLDIYSGESADVVCHELGHAVLDALKPQLFGYADEETSAFHEAFGDISALVCALQLKVFRKQLLEETSNSIHINSRLSRLAEQLGWALRRRGSVVDIDSLRNAANDFYYRSPSALPPHAPANQLSSQPHSFSRVFTGAFLEALARMFKTAPNLDEANLETTVKDAASILVGAIQATHPSPQYFSQIAAAMVLADAELHHGRYRSALTGAFVQRGILTMGSGMAIAGAAVAAPAHPRLQRTRASADDVISGGVDPIVLAIADLPPDTGFLRGYGQTPELPLQPVSIDAVELFAHVAAPDRSFDVTPSARSMSSGTAIEDDNAPRLFIEGLVARGELRAGELAQHLPFGHKSGDRATHEIVKHNDGRLVLTRVNFSCRCCGE